MRIRYNISNTRHYHKACTINGDYIRIDEWSGVDTARQYRQAKQTLFRVSAKLTKPKWGKGRERYREKESAPKNKKTKNNFTLSDQSNLFWLLQLFAYLVCYVCECASLCVNPELISFFYDYNSTVSCRACVCGSTSIKSFQQSMASQNPNWQP